jgi:hypothetical protein
MRVTLREWMRFQERRLIPRSRPTMAQNLRVLWRWERPYRKAMAEYDANYQSVYLEYVARFNSII